VRNSRRKFSFWSVTPSREQHTPEQFESTMRRSNQMPVVCWLLWCMKSL
jgi:hypothetical protein